MKYSSRKIETKSKKKETKIEMKIFQCVWDENGRRGLIIDNRH